MFKRVLLTSILGTVMTIIGAVAEPTPEDLKTVSSKAYVDTQVATKQLKIPAAGQPNVGAGETVMTYTANGDGEIGERGLYSDTSSYNAATDGDKLITASALNDTFTNLPTTDTTKLECANEGCTLWTIVDQSAYSFLPAGYTQLEYIESTGTQYIDTGYKPTSSSVLDLTITNFQTMQTSGKNLFGCGESTWSGSKGWVCAMAADSGRNSWNCKLTDRGVTYNNLGITTNNVYTLQYTSNGIFVDGVKKIDVSGTAAVPESYDRSFWLFKSNTNSAGYNDGSWRFGLTTLLDNGVLVRNFVPARRDSDNVLGMYDTVTNTFFTNAATSGDDFTAGPEI